MVLARVDVQDNRVLGGDGSLATDVPRGWKHLGWRAFTHVVPLGPSGHEWSSSAVGLNQEIKARALSRGLATAERLCVSISCGSSLKAQLGGGTQWGRLKKQHWLESCLGGTNRRNDDKNVVPRVRRPGFQVQLQR